MKSLLPARKRTFCGVTRKERRYRSETTGGGVRKGFFGGIPVRRASETLFRGPGRGCGIRVEDGIPVAGIRRVPVREIARLRSSGSFHGSDEKHA
jgi:hypothetical protein